MQTMAAPAERMAPRPRRHRGCRVWLRQGLRAAEPVARFPRSPQRSGTVLDVHFLRRSARVAKYAVAEPSRNNRWQVWSGNGNSRKSRFGDLVVIGFLLMQCLDAVFTYLGVALWGPEHRSEPAHQLGHVRGRSRRGSRDGKRGRDWLRHPAPPAAGAHSCRRFNGHLLCARDSPLDDFILLHEWYVGPDRAFRPPLADDMNL